MKRLRGLKKQHNWIVAAYLFLQLEFKVFLQFRRRYRNKLFNYQPVFVKLKKRE